MNSNVEYEYKKAFSEILTVIDASSLEVRNKIPKNVINFFQKNKLDNYIFELSNAKLIEQNLSDISKCIITILYMDYICDESSKIELQEIYNQKQKELISEIRNKNFIIQENMFFNSNNDSKSRNIENIDNGTNMQLVKRNKFKELIYRIIRIIRGI